MFCLKGKGNSNTKLQDPSRKDDFGWWLNNEDNLTEASSQNKDGQSLASSESMLSCIDSDDDESYSLAQEFKQILNDNGEGIELTSLIHGDLDVNLIEQDAFQRENEITPFPAKEAKEYMEETMAKSPRFQGMCYTPERLVRSQEYRILTPSPRYLTISHGRIVPENENLREEHRCRRRLNYLIDSKQVVHHENNDGRNKNICLGASQLKDLLNPNPRKVAEPIVTSRHWETCKQVCNVDSAKETEDSDEKMENTSDEMDQKKLTPLQSPELISKKCSYERLHVTWEDCKKMGTRSSSLEDTSGIQSNDWSSDTHSDLQNTPLCLSDELASTNYKLDIPQERCCAINEVVSILEALDTDPDKAAVLLEEDGFCDSTSSHDQLTRLALAIETDENVPVFENPNNLVHHLQEKVVNLQASTKDIFRDIYNLRKSFQCDEERITNISSDAKKLREDIQEMRCLDDLLNLLQGELERISKRNWPFVIGHSEHYSEEMNLIV